MSPSAVGRPRRPPYAYVRARKGAIVRCEKSLQSAQVDVFDVGVVVDVIAGAAWGDTERWEVRDARGRRGWVSAKVMAGVVAPSPPLPVADVDATAASTTSFAGRWVRGAERLRAMVSSMRGRGREAWAEGLRLGLPDWDRRDGTPYAGAHAPKYGKLGRELYDAASAAFAAAPPTPLRRVLEAVAEVCAPLEKSGGDDWLDVIDAPRAHGAKGDGPEGWPREPEAVPNWIKHVSLPLALYVRNTEQLYGMLARLHGLRHASNDAVDLEAALDDGDPPSAYLVFSVLAALQVLKRARRGHALRLEALATTAAGPACAVGGPGAFSPPPFGDGGGGGEANDDDDADFMYRGLWVAADGLDEDRVAMSSSFQSYSRHVPGACHVLRFYASSKGTDVAALARRDAHVLFLVVKGWRESAWVFPVEYFNDGALGGIERELLVPPFVGLRFDPADDVACRVPAAAHDDRVLAGLRRLRQRHGWAPPEALTRLMRGEVPLLGGHYAPRAVDKITIRFVTAFAPAAPLRAVFADDAPLLYDWRRPPPATGGGGHEEEEEDDDDDDPLAPYRACVRRAVDEDAVDAVRRRGYAVVDRALPRHLCGELRSELRRLRARNLMIRNRSYSVAVAGNGADDAPATNRRRLAEAAANKDSDVDGATLKRGIWEAEAHQPGVAETAPLLCRLFRDGSLADALAPLVDVRDQALRMQVNDGEGGRFAFHTDTASNLDDRQLTVLCYLNDGWDATHHGGELALLPYPDDEVLIEPLAGRIVVFDARNMVHATRPATKARYCFTVWLSGARKHAADFALPGYDAESLESAVDFRPQACKLKHADAFKTALRESHDHGGAQVLADHDEAVANIRRSVDVDQAVLDQIYAQLPWW